MLVVDTNRDDHADAEITAATWTERSEQQGVDALGVALAPDGSVYFSLGAASFTEPFLIEKATGRARYRTTMERGTIQRVSPDFATRGTVASGMRKKSSVRASARTAASSRCSRARAPGR